MIILILKLIFVFAIFNTQEIEASRFSFKSVVVEETYKGIGNKVNAITTSVNPSEEGSLLEGIVFCKNRGGKVAPGVNPAYASRVVLSDSETKIMKNGKVFYSATLEAENLQEFVGSCPNQNWSVLTFGPLEFIGTLRVLDVDGNELREDIYFCTLPNPQQIQYEDLPVDYHCYEL